MKIHSNHYIAIIGGSIAGSEAALQFAENKYKVVVFDQLALPYGKIEDGLPKWHVKLRDKEEESIDEKLQHPLIRFVPNCRLGRDIELQTLIEKWKFSAIILAIGAWKDRPLELPGIEKFINNGLIYQNPLIKWFNHYHEENYTGPHYEIPDGTAVIGGGLSSIDVIKIVQILIVQKALKEKGIEEDIFTLEKGIDKVLEKHQLSMRELGLKGATLFYRKRAKDMPLKSYEYESEREKAQEISEKMLQITKRKYLFNYKPNSVAVGTLIRNKQLDGLVFQRTLVENNRAIPIEGSEYDFHTSLVISSIGSLPETVSGVNSEQDPIKTVAKDACRIQGFTNVFAIGNAVTGRGNIKESRSHSIASANKITAYHLDPKKEQYQALLRTIETKVENQVKEIQVQMKTFAPLSDQDMEAIDKKISLLQMKMGYDEDYKTWKEKHLWERLENNSLKIHINK